MFTERDGRDATHRSVFEKGFRKAAIFEEAEGPDDEGKRGPRELDAFDVWVVELLEGSLKDGNEDVWCDLEGEATVDARLEQL